MSALIKGQVSPLQDHPKEPPTVDVSDWPESQTKTSQDPAPHEGEIDEGSSLEYESSGEESDIFELSQPQVSATRKPSCSTRQSPQADKPESGPLFSPIPSCSARQPPQTDEPESVSPFSQTLWVDSQEFSPSPGSSLEAGQEALSRFLSMK
jgi:hypothetical protein